MIRMLLIASLLSLGCTPTQPPKQTTGATVCDSVGPSGAPCKQTPANTAPPSATKAAPKDSVGPSGSPKQ